MRTARVFAMAVACGVVVGLAQPAAADDDSLSVATRGGNSDLVASYVDEIRYAPDPSAAVAAYARAVALDRTSLEARQAYVQRMVALGVPEMADTQARELTHRQPDAALAWAVMADADARRGLMSTAVSEVLAAVRYSPEAKFVQQVAGQIVAWFDTAANPAHLGNDVKQEISRLRGRLGTRTAFIEAYRQARAAYENQGGDQESTETTQPAPEDVTPQPVAPAEPVDQYPINPLPPVWSDDTYVDTWAYPYPYSGYWGGVTYYGGYGNCWWWPNETVVAWPCRDRPWYRPWHHDPGHPGPHGVVAGGRHGDGPRIWEPTGHGIVSHGFDHRGSALGYAGGPSAWHGGSGGPSGHRSGGSSFGRPQGSHGSSFAPHASRSSAPAMSGSRSAGAPMRSAPPAMSAPRSSAPPMRSAPPASAGRPSGGGGFGGRGGRR